MSVRLYDSRSQQLVDFVPLNPGRIGMYVCGPTVQSSPHIGHLRSALVYDQWRRWFSYRDFDVTLVRNVTDIDDKVLQSADDSDEEWWARAYRVELEFSAAYARLGIRPPSYEPRATASIPQMLELIGILIERGHAYPASDGTADVYFDTASWPAYGELTRQRSDDMADAADADPRGKRSPRDFALWKGSKDSEPASASWNSPWGPGRPGWHIECSTMAARYLGEKFDIHGGGLDLRFPHHENELAQSTAAGHAFAAHWMHNGLVTVDGQKMSKSIGNSVFAGELADRVRPLVVRYYLGAAHYRSTIDYHDGSLDEAEAALERIEEFLRRVDRRLAGTRFASAGTPVLPPEFAEAMDDDLAIPQALAVLHERVRAGNQALDSEELETAASVRGEVIVMTDILGINPLDVQWTDASDTRMRTALDSLVATLLTHRDDARSSRDFARADRIRSELLSVGIQLEDTPQGPEWRLE